MNLVGTLPQPRTHTQISHHLTSKKIKCESLPRPSLGLDRQKLEENEPTHAPAVRFHFAQGGNAYPSRRTLLHAQRLKSLHNRYMYCISEIHVMYAFHPPGPPDLTPCTPPLSPLIKYWVHDGVHVAVDLGALFPSHNEPHSTKLT